MVSERNVWVKAGVILDEHGEMTPDYIIDQLGDVLDSDVAVKNWRRVAAAADKTTGAKLQ